MGTASSNVREKGTQIKNSELNEGRVEEKIYDEGNESPRIVLTTEEYNNNAPNNHFSVPQPKQHVYSQDNSLIRDTYKNHFGTSVDLRNR